MLDVLLLVGGIAQALPPQPPMKASFQPYQTPMNILCWPSGLQVVVSRQEGDRHVAISTVIEGGDSAEPADAHGAAHLLEHLWFRSVQPGSTASVWDASTGLSITASTRLDSTVYTTIGAPEDLPALLALEGQRLANPLLGVTAAIVATEREVVKREFLQRGGETTAVGLRLLDSVLYPTGHPYHGVALTAATLDALTLEDVKAYAASSYRPVNTTIRLEGAVPVETEALSALIQGAFSASALGGPGSTCLHRAEPKVPDRPASSEVAVAEAPIWYQRFYLGWTLPPAHDASVGVMDEAAAFVGQALRQKLAWIPGLRGSQEGRGSAACGVQPAQLSSKLYCVVDVPQGVDPDAVVRGIREAVGALWHDPEDYEDGLRARMAGFWVGAMQEATAVGLDASEHRALWSHFGDQHNLFDGYGAVGIIDGRGLVEFGRKWVTPERIGVALLRPVPGSADRPAAQTTWKPRLDAPVASRWTPVGAEVDALVATKLDRGLSVWSSTRGRNEPALAQTALTFRGGWLDTAEPGLHEALLATATWYLPVDSSDLEQATATRWWTAFDGWTAGAGSIGNAGNLDAQLWQTAAFLTLDVESDRRQEALDDDADVFRDEERACDYVLAEPWLFTDARRREHLLGAVPGALPWWERNRAARSIRIGSVETWQKAVFRPENGMLVIAGAVDPATALAEADRYLGGWKGSRGEPAAPPPPPAPPPAAQVEVLPVVRSLTQVAVSCRVPGRTAGNEASLDVLQRVLRRGMWQTFREDGRVYTPSAWVEPAQDEVALLTLEVDVLPGEGGASAKALLGLLDLVAKGVPEPVVAAAKKEAATGFGLDLADTTGTVDRLITTWATGGTLDDVKTWPARLDAVDSAGVARLLTDCVGHEAVSVIGSDDPAALGIGLPVEVHEPRELARRLAERMD